MEWDESTEKFLSKLQMNSYELYLFYNKKYIIYQQTHQKYNIPILVLSAINSLVALTLPDFIRQEYVSIINAVISAGTGILGSILLYLRVNEKVNICFTNAYKLNTLQLKICKELSIERSARKSKGSQFLNECFQEYLSCLDSGIPIDKKLKNYMSEFERDIQTIPSETTSANNENILIIENENEQEKIFHV